MLKITFLQHCILSLGNVDQKITGASKGGGVGILVRKKFTADIKSSLETVGESFFKSIWSEITDPLTENLLVNNSYCPN